MTSVLIRSACALATFTDTTLTKVLPGLALDAISSTPPPESLRNLVKWGEAKGGKDLSLQSLQYKHRVFYPFEYVRTSFVASARKTYFYAATQNVERKSTSDLLKKIRSLAIEHYQVTEKKDQLSLDTLESDAKIAIEKTQKKGSFLATLRNLPHKYPNTRARHYLAWGIRCGISYYLSPTNSRGWNMLVTATCLYAWTILLTSGARKDLASIQISDENQQTTLPQSAQDAITSSAASLFSEEKDSFKDALGTLQVQNSIRNPFPKSAEDFRTEYLELLQERKSHTEETLEWYQADWQMRTAMIGYHRCNKSSAKEQTQLEHRKKYWLDWHAKDKTSALSFIRAQTDVPKEEWKKWITKKRRERVQVLDD